MAGIMTQPKHSQKPVIFIDMETHGFMIAQVLPDKEVIIEATQTKLAALFKQI